MTILDDVRVMDSTQEASSTLTQELRLPDPITLGPPGPGCTGPYMAVRTLYRTLTAVPDPDSGTGPWHRTLTAVPDPGIGL